MAGPITSGALGKLMRPGLNDIFGLKYEQYPDEWSELYEHNVSHLGYEEETMVTSMNLAQVIPEGGSVAYDDVKQAYTSRYKHVEYGLGFIVTKIEVQDNLYMSAADMRTSGLAYSMKQTKNYNGVNIFNYAFDVSGHPGADGVAFCSVSHPTESGLQANTLSVTSDLSESSLEEMLLMVYDTRDNRGKKMALREELLLIPYPLEFEATRILKNPQRPGTAERDINAMNMLGKFPKGIYINHFLTDPGAWFIKTTCPNGAKYFERWPLEFDEDNDFPTSNMLFKATERYSFGVSDFRSYYGMPSA